MPTVGEDSRRGEDAPASHTNLLFVAQGHKARGVMQGIGGGEGIPNAPETGYWQSVADHSTAGREPDALGREGGEPVSQGPTGGKEMPGITFFWRDLWERLRAHQPYP